MAHTGRRLRSGGLLTTVAIAAGLALTPAPAAASAAAAWDCPQGWICLYDHAGGVGRFYAATDGCWFDNIGLQGLGDRATSVYNRTSHRVNLANWNGSAWEHLVHADPGQAFNLPASADNRTDAVHVIC
ncbi:peptidase inhibitor family I36 protein [Streptomyces sp. YIM 98790]|uniref:peptidase inhibitor family I36 protein n=1 Tax=Streptomyces sp. YIM 98790 TaxID=2689077 RepID=UPI00140CFE43|nr:peptidase inhibitor family I36 protein [Streptomyces sp. YIM 98790]